MTDGDDISWGQLVLILLQATSLGLSMFVLMELYIDHNPMPAQFCVVAPNTPPSSSLDRLE